MTIVGAGAAGLTIAHQLITQGRRVTVVERDTFVGGLARSWHYGEFHFDVGPHRFHTENPRVAAFIREILQEGPSRFRARAGRGCSARSTNGPCGQAPVFDAVRADVPLRVGPAVQAEVAGESFEADWSTNTAARSTSLLQPYTRKFLFHSPAELHRDWARAGVNRAVIDQRAAADRSGPC